MTREEKVNSIIAKIAEYQGITFEDITGTKRAFSHDRHLAWYIHHVIFKMSYKTIRSYFSVKDHTSVLHGKHKILNNPAFVYEAGVIIKRLKIDGIISEEIHLPNDTSQGYVNELIEKIRSLESELISVKAKYVDNLIELNKSKSKIISLYTQSKIVNKIINS